MSAIADAAAAIVAAVKTVPGVRVYTDITASVEPPCVVVGPPRLFWDVLTDKPTRATFELIVVSSADDRIMTRLWDLVPAVAAAVSQAAVDAGVDEAGATPTIYTAGGANLPAYSIPVTATLEG